MDRLVLALTVGGMRFYISSENPAGHTLVARLPENSSVSAHFYDEDAARDITGFLCDLILVGMHARFEIAQGLASADSEPVEVAAIRLENAVAETLVFTYAHPQSGVALDFGWDDAAELLSVGISHQITSGVAAEAAEVPDAPVGVDLPEPRSE